MEPTPPGLTFERDFFAKVLARCRAGGITKVLKQIKYDSLGPFSDSPCVYALQAAAAF
jgi:hypothetical protein